MKPVKKIKAKYYSRTILKYLLVAGLVVVSGSGPYFAARFWQNVFRNQKLSQRKHADVFRYLLKRGLVEWQREGHDIHVTLTKEGRKYAGKYQIDDLSLERPSKWDGKWRVVIFDIPSTSKTSNLIRNVFRAKIKSFGFCLLQKSIWIFPFPCKEEINFLREFLGANKKQIQVLEVDHIEDDEYFKKIFHL